MGLSQHLSDGNATLAAHPLHSLGIGPVGLVCNRSTVQQILDRNAFNNNNGLALARLTLYFCTPRADYS